MEYRPLGRTGVQVSKLCLGTMMFGAWGNTDHDDSIRIIHRALDAGINFVDTADVYSAGESEEIHGAMARTPTRKAAHAAGSSARSLRRLQTDWLDLYQLHRPRDIEDTLSALRDLVHQGKVRYIGHSTSPASQIVEAQWIARRRGLQRFVTEQRSRLPRNARRVAPFLTDRT